jgi:hypothetical protein
MVPGPDGPEAWRRVTIEERLAVVHLAPDLPIRHEIPARQRDRPDPGVDQGGPPDQGGPSSLFR